MSDDNAKLYEGIAYFEKMLKLMPGDRTTLEFLSVAYEQVGDAEKARVSLIQLASTLLREKDYDVLVVLGAGDADNYCPQITDILNSKLCL